MAGGVKVGELYGELRIDRGSFDRDLDRSGTTFGKLTTGIKKGGLVIGASLAAVGLALGAVAVKALGSAVEQERALVRLRQVFGKNAGDVQRWAEQNALHLGVNDDVLEASVAKYAEWAMNAGMSTAEATEAAQALATRAAEISRVTGQSYDEVFAKLQKGAQGSTRGLKDLGVAVDEGSIKEEAYRLGLAKRGDKLTELEEAQARQSLILGQTASYTAAAADESLKYATANAQLGVIMDTVMDTIGAAVLSVVQAAMPPLLAAFDAFSKWVTDNGPLIETVLGTLFDIAGKAVGLFAGLVGGLLEKLGGLTSSTSGLGDTLQGLADGALATVGGIFDWWTTNVLPVLSAGLDAVVSVIGSIGSVLGTIATTAGPAFGEIFRWIGEEVAPKVNDVLRFLANDVLPGVASLFDTIAKTAGPLLGDVLRGIAETVLPLLRDGFTLLTETVVPLFRAALDGVVTFVGENWPTVQAVIETVKAGIDTALTFLTTEVLPPLQAAFDSAVAFVSEHWPTIEATVETVKQAVGTAIDLMKGAIEAAFEAVRTAIDIAVPVIADVGEAVFPALQTAAETLQGVIETVWSAVQSAITVAVDTFRPLVDALPGVFQALWEAGETLSGQLKWWWDRITDWVRDAIGVFQPLIEAITTDVLPALATAGETLSSAMSTVWAGIQTAVSGAVEVFRPIIETLTDDVLPALGTAGDALGKGLGEVFAGIGSVVDQAAGAITGAFDTIKTTWDGLVSFFEGVMDGIGDAIRSGVNVFIDAWNMLDFRIPKFVLTWDGVSIPNPLHGTIADIFGTPQITVLPGGRFDVWAGTDDLFRDIPRLATGTDWFHGGLAMVGEAGPELVNLPRGTEVFPAGETRDMLAGGRGALVGQQTVNVYGLQPDDVERQTTRALRRAALAWAFEG